MPSECRNPFSFLLRGPTARSFECPSDTWLAEYGLPSTDNGSTISFRRHGQTRPLSPVPVPFRNTRASAWVSFYARRSGSSLKLSFRGRGGRRISLFLPGGSPAFFHVSSAEGKRSKALSSFLYAIASAAIRGPGPFPAGMAYTHPGVTGDRLPFLFPRRACRFFPPNRDLRWPFSFSLLFQGRCRPVPFSRDRHPVRPFGLLCWDRLIRFRRPRRCRRNEPDLLCTRAQVLEVFKGTPTG